MSNENKSLSLPLALISDRFYGVRSEVQGFVERMYTLDRQLRNLLGNFKQCMGGTPSNESDLVLPIRAYNAASLLIDALDSLYPEGDDDRLCDLRGYSYSLASAAESLINKVGDSELKLRLFACPKCGHEIQMYTYDDTEDTRLTQSGLFIPDEDDLYKTKDEKFINTKAVYEFMHVSHLCDGCWQHFVCKGE